jgi:hypothetical protein
VAPAATTTATKRRTAKAKADDVSDTSSTHDDPPEAPRPRRGKGKVVEVVVEDTRTSMQGRRTPAAAATRARATAPSAKSTCGRVLEKEKENTLERVHVKEEDKMQQQQPAVVAAVKGVRTHKATTAA